MSTEALRKYCAADQYTPRSGLFAGQAFDYLLFEPQALKVGASYPLIVWLHGYGDYEFDPDGQIKHFELLLTSEQEVATAEFYLLAVQCPPDPGSWFTYRSSKQASSRDDPGDIVARITKKIINEKPVNPDAVSLVGISGGGSACWEMVCRYPDLFAAVAPLSGAAGDPAAIDAFDDIPIWAFHNSSDYVIRVEPVRRLIQTINAAGGSAHLTEPYGSDHNSWTPAFERYRLLHWLLVQDRTSWIKWNPPGTRPWQRREAAVQFLVVSIPIAAWFAERNRRRRLLTLNAPDTRIA